MTDTFALVLGLVAFLYLAGMLVVLSFEINVVCVAVSIPAPC